MQSFHPKYLLVAALASLPLLSTSCKQCGQGAPPPPSFGLAFSTDTLGAGKGYRKAEALSAYLVRYAGPDLSQPLDTVRANRRPTDTFYYLDRTLFCNLPINSTSNAGPHSYRLEVPTTKQRFDITDIVLQYGGVSDCTSSIDRLDALINNQRVDARRGYVLTK